MVAPAAARKALNDRAARIEGVPVEGACVAAASPTRKDPAADVWWCVALMQLVLLIIGVAAAAYRWLL